jgi:hypothetical protein
MTCINLTSPTDEQINAVVDGLGEPEVLAHLAACEHCRSRVQAIQDMNAGLRAILYRRECPPVHMLGEYELNLLPPDVFEGVKAHVHECPLCQQELNELREFMMMPDVPAIDVRVSPAAPVPQRKVPARRNVLVAQPLQQVAAYASRGSAAVIEPGTTIQERGAAHRGINLDSEPLHEVKGITIFMEVREGEGGQRFLFGQLILDNFADWVNALVELRQNERVMTISAVDSTTGFRCRLTNHEPFDVRITSRTGTVLLLNDVLPGR